MRSETRVIAGLLLCATMIQAQGVSTGSFDGNIQRSTGVSFRDILGTNGVFYSPWNGRLFSEEMSSDEGLYRAAESDLSEKNSVYQVTVPLPAKDELSGSAGRPGHIMAIDAKPPPVRIFTAGDDLYWKYRGPRTSETSHVEGAGKKKTVQILVVEPPNDAETVSFDRFEIPENLLIATRPMPAWYEWFDPRLFIPRYVELWTKGSEASPVVLILCKF